MPTANDLDSLIRIVFVFMPLFISLFVFKDLKEIKVKFDHLWKIKTKEQKFPKEAGQSR